MAGHVRQGKALLCVDHFPSHANAHVALDLIAPLAADGAHVDQIADARRILQRLHTHTLPALPPRCRQAFILNRLDGLTHPQVAAAMGISIKMVEKHISRAWPRAVLLCD